MKSIQTQNLSKTFTHINSGKKVEVLKNINIEILENESVAILGMNGAGKSTLLKILCGSLYATSGLVNINGSISWPVGFGGGFDNKISALDNIKFISHMMCYGYDKSKDIQDYIENAAGLKDKLDYLVGAYSSGMKSRLFFHTSIVFDFDFYLFDEISAVGDKNFEGSSNSILEDLKLNHGMICVTHNTSKVSRYCDYGYVLDCGTISEKLNIEEAIREYEAL